MLLKSCRGRPNERRLEWKTAYSLMGLNMPMLYGEGKNAFHRLQLEIIRASNDQSIFAWDYSADDMRIGSILADDPSCFEDYGEMELMSHNEFIKLLKEDVREEELNSIEDRLGTFPVTNRGIQIWMLLCSRLAPTLAHSSTKPGCRAAVVHGIHQWPLVWFCGNPITIDVQCHDGAIHSCSWTISSAGTFTIASSLSRISRPAASQRHIRNRRYRTH